MNFRKKNKKTGSSVDGVARCKKKTFETSIGTFEFVKFEQVKRSAYNNWKPVKSCNFKSQFHY